MRTRAERRESRTRARLDTPTLIAAVAAVFVPFTGAVAAQEGVTASADESVSGVDEILVTADPNRVLQNAPSASAADAGQATSRAEF